MDQIDSAEPDIESLMELFIQFYGNFKNAFLLIDGLDEANKSDQRNVKAFLKRVQDMDSARILVLSHQDIDMSNVFLRTCTLQITPEALKGDIELFVHGRIEEHLHKELAVCPTSMIDIIKGGLISNADEMYRHLSC
jgi:hypothetical protein